MCLWNFVIVILKLVNIIWLREVQKSLKFNFQKHTSYLSYVSASWRKKIFGQCQNGGGGGEGEGDQNCTVLYKVNFLLSDTGRRSKYLLLMFNSSTCSLLWQKLLCKSAQNDQVWNVKIRFTALTNTEDKCVQCWLNELLIPLFQFSVHQKYDLHKKPGNMVCLEQRTPDAKQGRQLQPCSWSVPLRPWEGEEVGRVARIQPPTKLVVAQFRIHLATPWTFLSMF